MANWSEVSLSGLAHGYRIDSEFYKQEYLDRDQILEKFKLKTLGSIGKVTDGEHGSVKLLKDGIKYLTAENIKNGYIDIEKVRHVSNEVDDRNARARVNINDILISIKGTLGQVGIAEEWLLPANMNRDVAIIKLNTSETYKLFVALFLQTKYGLYQLAREGSGGVQQMITLGRLREIKVPSIDETLYDQCAESYVKALSLKQLSKSLYIKAQDILEKELGLDDLVTEKFIGYETSFSEVMRNGRSDPEFFHAKFDSIIEKIKEYRGGAKPLYQISKVISPNFNASKNKDNFNYIEIGDINISDGSYTTMSIPAKNLPANAKIKLSGGELLISQVRPTRGAIAIIDDDLQEDTICSGAFYTCKIIDGEQKETIFLYLRIVKGVFEKYCGGTSYPTIDSRYLKFFLVPIFEMELSKTIKTLIIESKQAMKESEKLLESAKKRIEDLIEGGIWSWSYHLKTKNC